MIQLYATTFLQKELENCPESRGKVWMLFLENDQTNNSYQLLFA